MMWSGLFRKIGKQPARIIDNENVVAIFSRNELLKMLNQKKPTYLIPLALKHGTGKRKMWFIADFPKQSEKEREREI